MACGQYTARFQERKMCADTGKYSGAQLTKKNEIKAEMHKLQG